MKTLALGQRVAVLEEELAGLKARRGSGRVMDWRRTVGPFTCNPGMKYIFAEAMKIRESDRRKARSKRLVSRRPTGGSANELV
jgi:hypothetical protein